MRRSEFRTVSGIQNAAVRVAEQDPVPFTVDDYDGMLVVERQPIAGVRRRFLARFAALGHP
jgi:hypothetical protein